MTNKIESVCEQMASLFHQFACEVRSLRDEMAELQIQSNKHETLKDELKELLNKY